MFRYVFAGIVASVAAVTTSSASTNSIWREVFDVCGASSQSAEDRFERLTRLGWKASASTKLESEFRVSTFFLGNVDGNAEPEKIQQTMSWARSLDSEVAPFKGLVLSHTDVEGIVFLTDRKGVRACLALGDVEAFELLRQHFPEHRIVNQRKRTWFEKDTPSLWIGAGLMKHEHQKQLGVDLPVEMTITFRSEGFEE